MQSARIYVQYIRRKRKPLERLQICARIGRSGRGAAKKSRAAARNIKRVQAFFLHTFSDKPEKVCPRSDGRGVAARTAVPVKPDRRADVGIGPYKRV